MKQLDDYTIEEIKNLPIKELRRLRGGPKWLPRNIIISELIDSKNFTQAIREGVIVLLRK